MKFRCFHHISLTKVSLSIEDCVSSLFTVLWCPTRLNLGAPVIFCMFAALGSDHRQTTHNIAYHLQKLPPNYAIFVVSPHCLIHNKQRTRTRDTLTCLTSSHIDHCKALFSSFQNVAACCSSHSWPYMILIFKTLHWLPVAYRIQFKIITLAYRALHRLAPAYAA